MAVYEYWWGTERPQLQEARYQRMADVLGQAARARLQAQFDAGMAEVDRITAASSQRVGLIRMSLVGGRYNREVANTVAAQHGLLGSGDAVKRGRGRPRKYGPDDIRPARPSRAKTDAGRLRALSKQFPKRGPRGVEARLNSGTVSPVTASPARAIAPKAAVEIGRALLTGTIAAQQEIAAPVEVEVVVDDGVLVAEPAAKAEPTFDVGAIAARYQSSLDQALQELSGDELSDDGVLLLSNFIRNHKVQHQVSVPWVRGQDGARKLPYDFSDAMDESKAPPEVRALFKGFGLCRHSPSSEMSEEDLQLWMKRAIFNGVDSPEADFDRYLKRTGSGKDFYQRYKRTFEPDIERERLRVMVWPSIERRLHFVERTYDLMSLGKLDIDTAMVRVADFDFLALNDLRFRAHNVYREIVDAMRWFDGFSRLDIAKWSGHDPDNVPLCKVKQGFPGWTFPKHLHDAVLDGYMFNEPATIDYKVPSVSELVEFAATDRELLIANLRLRGDVDYAEIDL